jgi:hypothetical protein
MDTGERRQGFEELCTKEYFSNNKSLGIASKQKLFLLDCLFGNATVMHLLVPRSPLLTMQSTSNVLLSQLA